MRQPVQCANAIFVQCLEWVIKKAFDARFEVVHRRVDERDDEHFLIVAERTALNDLRRQRGEDVRLARTRDSGNTEAPAVVAEDILLGGTRGEVRCHGKTSSLSLRFSISKSSLGYSHKLTLEDLAQALAQELNRVSSPYFSIQCAIKFLSFTESVAI